MKKVITLIMTFIMCFSCVSEVFAAGTLTISSFTPRKDFLKTSYEKGPKGKTIDDSNATIERWGGDDNFYTVTRSSIKDPENSNETSWQRGAIEPKDPNYIYIIKPTSDYSTQLIRGTNSSSLKDKVNKAGDFHMTTDNAYFFNVDSYDFSGDDSNYPKIIYKNMRIYDPARKKYMLIDLVVSVRKAGKKNHPDKDTWGNINAVMIGKSKGAVEGLPNVRIVGVSSIQLRCGAYLAGTYKWNSKGEKTAGKRYKFRTALTYGDIDSYQAVGSDMDNTSGAAAHKNANMHFGVEDGYYVASSNSNTAHSEDEKTTNHKYKILYYLNTTKSSSDGYVDMSFTSRQSQKNTKGNLVGGASSEENEPNGNWAYFGPSVYPNSPVMHVDIEQPRKLVSDSNTANDLDNNWIRDEKDDDDTKQKKSYSHNVLGSSGETIKYTIIQKIPPYMYAANNSDNEEMKARRKVDFESFVFTDKLESCFEVVGTPKVYSVRQSVGAGNALISNPLKTNGNYNDITSKFKIELPSTSNDNTISAAWKSTGTSKAAMDDRDTYLYGANGNNPSLGAIVKFVFEVKIKDNVNWSDMETKYGIPIDIPNRAKLTYAMRSNSKEHPRWSLASKTVSDSSDSPTWADASDNGKHVYTRIPSPGKIRLIKVDDNGARLQGAKFVLKDGKGNIVVSEKTTNSNGEINFGEVVAGTYYIYETAAPTGFTKITAATEVVVPAGETKTVTITNRKPSIRIIKLDSETGGELTGATFQIYSGQSATGTPLSLKVGNTTKNTFNAKEVITGFTFNESSSTNYFTIKETSAPAGYIANGNGTKTFNLAIQNGVQEIKMYNDPKTGTITIRKVDNQGNYLTGAKFELHRDSATGILVDTKTVGSDGKATFTVSSLKTYFLVEKEAPAGYRGSGPYRITTDANVNTTVVNTANNTTINKNSTWYDLPNTPVQAGFTLLKRDTLTQNALTGATFVLSGTKANGDDITPITKNTQSDGTASFTNIPEGSYKLVETIAPAAHFQDVASWSVVIDNNGTVKIENQTINGTFVIDNPPTKVWIRKKDMSNQLLAGATLAIYEGAHEGQTIPSGTPIVSIPNTNNGATEVTGKLSIGTQYTLVETNAPTGFKRADNVVFTVTNAAKSATGQEVSMRDEPMSFSIPIRKTNMNGDPVGGATFELRTDVNTANTSTSRLVTNNGQAVWENLAAGTYYIVETGVPNGYLKGGPLRVVCNANGTMTVTDQRTNTTVSATNGYYNFRNPEPGPASITLTKIKTGDPNTKLSGAQFVLSGTSANGTNVYKVATYSGGASETTSTGQFTFTDIPIGTDYTITEIKVPTGYSIANAYKVDVTYNSSTGTSTATLRGNSNTSYNTNKYIQNDYQETVKHDVVFTKKDEGGQIVQGVRFELMGPSGFATREYVSGSNGKVTITELGPGTYTLRETYVPSPYTTLKTWTITVGADNNG